TLRPHVGRRQRPAGALVDQEDRVVLLVGRPDGIAQGVAGEARSVEIGAHAASRLCGDTSGDSRQISQYPRGLGSASNLNPSRRIVLNADCMRWKGSVVWMRS